MSKTKYVSYHDSGFWAYDVSLGVLLKHLLDEVQTRQLTTKEEWLREASSEWRQAACIQDIGLSLSPAWSPSQLSVVTNLLELACAAIAARPAFSAAEVGGWPLLDDLRIFARGADIVESAPVVELGRAVISLLAGSHVEPPAGSDWYYGFPEGRTLYPPPKG